MRYFFTLSLFIVYLSFMPITYAQQDCCNIEPEVTAVATPDCTGIELCISGYEGCEDTWFKFHAYDHQTNENHNNGGRLSAENCYTFTDLNLDGRFSFTVSVGLPDECAENPMDLQESYSLYGIDFSNCEPINCCKPSPDLIATPTADCTGVELCVSGYESCEGLQFKFHAHQNNIDYNNGGNFTTETCFTFTGLDLSNGDIDFTLTVALADECATNPMDLLHYFHLLDIDFSDCTPTIDPCCMPPNIADVEFNQIPGFNWLEICMPEAPCPDEEGLFYGIRFLELCGGEPGTYSITSNRTNCLYFRYQPGCEYRFQAGYHSYSCSPVEWSEEYIFEPDGNGKTAGIHRLSATATQAYPNPFKEAFQIQFTTENTASYQLAIYDLQGKQVLSLAGQATKGINHITIDQLNDLPSGNYYYQLLTGGQHFSNKIVKY